MIIKTISILFLSLSFLSACAHSPRCGNPEGTKIILEGNRTCSVRIRQVLIGNELKIPESLKNPELANLELHWVDPMMKEGQIITGHFILIPKGLQ